MTKQQLYEYNMFVLEYYGELPQINIQYFSDIHVRITRVSDGKQMDFYPTTGRAIWMGFIDKKTFLISDIDRYLEEKFAPQWWLYEPFGKLKITEKNIPERTKDFQLLVYKTNSIYKQKH